jgi:hypothetical protein
MLSLRAEFIKMFTVEKFLLTDDNDQAKQTGANKDSRSGLILAEAAPLPGPSPRRLP